MGQKVNPTGFRIGILQGWKSNWYTERDYAAYLDEDRAVRGHIMRKHAGAQLTLSPAHCQLALCAGSE